MLKKSFLIRSAAALAVAAALASCGGGTNYTIGGVVYGLQPNSTLVLTTNGMEVSVTQTGKADASGNVPNVSYSFPKQLEYGEVYNVIPQVASTAADGTVTYKQPAHQTCVASGRISDTAGRLSEISADYTCALVAPTIGGVVKGLVTGSVVLSNGSDATTTIAAATTPTNPPADIPYSLGAVTYGKTYGVTVTSSPAGYNCSVVNAVGTMGDNAVGNIDVTCVATPP
ncbi:hypothetical protein QPK31_05160 [Massilia sp. YIM B02769]|nr:hypothetical protein [Massilia sp. YIM B02769]